MQLILDIAGNRLPVGSVIMCKMTLFVIVKDGDMNILSSWFSRSRNFTWKGGRDS